MILFLLAADVLDFKNTDLYSDVSAFVSELKSVGQKVLHYLDKPTRISIDIAENIEV
jgi:hypothetical protein